MQVLGIPQISTGLTKSIWLDKNNVETYEVVDETHAKSTTSAASRALVGGFFLGPAGMLAGALSSKTKDAYIIAVQFKNGGKSLLEVDEKIYKTMVRCLF